MYVLSFSYVDPELQGVPNITVDMQRMGHVWTAMSSSYKF